MGGRRRTSGEASNRQRDVETLKEDVQKLGRQPN
jgi:hypothetical protein